MKTTWRFQFLTSPSQCDDDPLGFFFSEAKLSIGAVKGKGCCGCLTQWLIWGKIGTWKPHIASLNRKIDGFWFRFSLKLSTDSLLGPFELAKLPLCWASLLGGEQEQLALLIQNIPGRSMPSSRIADYFLMICTPERETPPADEFYENIKWPFDDQIHYCIVVF